MKHLKLFFALFAMLALGVTNAWGAEASFTIKFKDNGSDASTALTTATFTKQVAEGTDLIKSVSTSYCYAGTGGLKCSSNKNNGTFTLTLNNSYTISKIVLSVKNKNATTKTVKVGNTSFSTSDSWNTTSFEDLAFTGTETTSDQITVSLAGSTNNKRVAYIASMTVYYKTDESGSEEPVISVEPNKVDFGTKNIYFESEKQGSLEIDITGQNLTGDVSAAISGADASVFTLSKTTFTPNSGEVSEKLSVSYSVSEVKTYTATLTLSSDGVDDIELPITLTTVNKKPTIYTKVTDAATLSAGDKVIFVYEAGKVAAGKLSSGYLTSIDIAQAINTTANPATVSITDEAVIEYTLGGTTGAWEFISASGKLSEASANSTKSVDLAYNKGTTWTIAISSGNATIKGTTNTIQYNEANPRFKTYTSGQKTIQLYAISVPKYAVNFAQPEGGKLIVKNGENAIVSGNTFAEGIKLTVIANPANGYEGGTVVVKDAVGNDVTATVYADGVLTMPAYAVTISATFEKKECTLLATPTVSATTTYNSATLSWGAVTKAAKYSVKIGDKDAVETTATSYEVTDLNAETTYTYQVQAIAEAGQDTDCDSEVAEGTFTTTAAPAAKLTLKDIVGETTKTGALNSTITLPKTAAECSKTFVGWDAKSDCAVAPEYAPGAEYTLAAETQTLYAVYADGEGGGNFTITKTMSEIVAENEYTVSEGTNVTCYTNLTLDENITLSTTGEANCGSFWKDPREWRLYQNKSGNAIVTASDGCSLTSVKFTFSVDKTGTFLNAGVAMQSGTAVSASGKSATYTVGNSKNDVTNGQVKITAVEVSYSKEGEYSNYSTTCAAAPKAEVDPTSVTATAAETTGKLTVTYDNVNTEDVTVALYNDAACTDAFTADWLTASLDGDKNIAYTVAATTLYTERKAYIKLTAPETTGAIDPAVVVIPVTQVGKDKVFASLEELLANITPTEAATKVTVTLTKEPIVEIYVSGTYRNGIYLNVPYQGENKKIEIYCRNVPATWVLGGSVSGTLTNCDWKDYNGTWELCPADWSELTYTAPATVSSIAVSGTPTTTTYVDGEKFDPAGLVVTATYSDATTEVVTTYANWTIEPATLTKGQTSVNVTATYNSISSAAHEVTGLTVNDIPTKTVAEFIAARGTRCYLEGVVSGLTEGNSMKYGNFDLTDASGTIYVYGCLNASGEKEKFAELDVKNGDKIKVIADELTVYNSKDQAKNVQYVSHISAATITIENITLVEGDEHAIVAIVTPAEAEGKVTYSIKSGSEYISLAGNVITANAVGTATITATIETAADYMGTTKDFTVTIKEYVAPISGRWELVTDASTLKAGDKVIVAQYVEEDGTIYTMGVQKANNRDVVESSVSNTTLTPTMGTTVLTLVDAGNGTFALQVDNGKYLYAASNTSNHLKETATINDNAKWSVSVTDGKASVVAQGAHTHNTIRFNKSNNPKIFSCYESGQQDIALYKKMPDYTRDVRPGYYGTICLPNGGMMVGASIFEIAYKDASKIYFDEIVSGKMEAGIPYIFLPNEGVTTLKVFYTEMAVVAAGSRNGLVGSYTQERLTEDGNNYILLNNQYCKVIGEAYVGANRAYFQLSSIPDSAPAPAHGVRRVSMGMAGQNTATGVDQVEGNNVPTKMIINGQLFILRGEKMYDAQGKLVK